MTAPAVDQSGHVCADMSRQWPIVEDYPRELGRHH